MTPEQTTERALELACGEISETQESNHWPCPAQINDDFASEYKCAGDDRCLLPNEPCVQCWIDYYMWMAKEVEQ